MVEPEVAFNDSAANMHLQERFVSYVVGRTLEQRAEELKELERDTTTLQRVQVPFARISYTDAVSRLNGLGSDITWGSDLGGDDETLLAKEFDRPVFVFNYPKQVKDFYM
jgi:asparaginyl-tRNA synthetase